MVMNINIYQITMLISKQQVLTLGLFKDGKSKNKSKYLVFFHLIHDHKVTNDQESIIYLNYKNKSSYLKFKERYSRKLLDYILLTDVRVKSVDKTLDPYLDLLRLYCSARVLHLRNHKRSAVVLYENISKKAFEREYFDILLFVTVHLKQHYAYIDPNKRLFKKYSEQLVKCEWNLSRLNSINNYYDNISHQNIILGNNDLSSFKKSTLDTTKQLIGSILEEDSYEYKNKVYEISAYGYNLNENYIESIKYSKKSIALTEMHFKTMHTNILASYKDILSAYLRLKQYENAKIYLSKILGISKTISHNYFRYKSLEFSLYINTLEHNKLYELTQNILSLKKLKDFKIHKEEWAIREAFVNILVEAGKVDSKLVETSKRKFRLNRFINEVEFYSKDKRGSNISVLVIQLIHFLMRKQYDKIIDKLDALNQYTFRYLRNDDTLRSNCFIKMLLKLPEAEYHPIRTKRYVAKYEKKLAENPFEISMKEIAIEIIPYEQLWDIIMEILNVNLEQKKRKR